jgi:hypothetical protein
MSFRVCSRPVQSDAATQLAEITGSNWASVSAISWGVSNRSNGRLLIIRFTTPRSGAGIPGRNSSNGRGSSCWCLISFSSGEKLPNGGWPQSR